MDWINYKANIAKFIPSQWGHIKDYTDMTNRDTEAERSKHERFTIDNYFTLMLCRRCVLDLHNKVTTSEALISDYKVRSQVHNNVKSSLIMVYYLY